MRLYRFLRFLFYWPVRLLFRIRILHRERIPDHGGYILASNHITLADPVPLAVLVKEPIRFMAKAELFGIPLLKQLFSVLGVIPVNRQRPELSTIKRCIRVLKDGGVLGLFPQGTRIREEDAMSARAGVAMIAAKAKAGILPVCLVAKNHKIRPFRRTTIVVGRLIPFEDMDFSGGSASYGEISGRVIETIHRLGREVQ